MLREVVDTLSTSPRVREAMDEVRHLDLIGQLQFLSFIHLNSCMDLTRPYNLCREVGALRVTPFHFPDCLPLSYFPFQQTRAIGKAKIQLRPGKLLLRMAMRDILPDAITFRTKLPTQVMAPREWLVHSLSRMARVGRAVDFSRSYLGQHLPLLATAVQRNVIALAFLNYVLDGGRPSSSTPPAWNDLDAHPRFPSLQR